MRICCVVHGPSGFAVTPRICTYREPASITKKQYRRCKVTAQSTWKKSAASIVAACARRKFRHVVSARRWGAGGIFRALRTRRIVDALTRWPTLSSSPWILLYPQPLFSHSDLMSQHQELGVLRGRRPTEQYKPAAEPDEDEIKQAEGHG